MNALRRLAAATLAAVCIALAAASTASAGTQEPPHLVCIPAGIWSTQLSVQLGFENGGTALTNASGSLTVSWDGGDSWDPVAALDVSQGSAGKSLSLPGFFDDRGAWPAIVKWESNIGSATCDTYQFPADVAVSAPSVITYGQPVTFFAQFRAPTLASTSTLVADVFFDDGFTQNYLGTTNVTEYGMVSMFSFSPPYSGSVKFELFDDAADPDHYFPLNVSDGPWIQVSHPSPLMTYNKTVVSGQRVNMRFWIGGPDTYYHVEIQRYNGQMWIRTGAEDGAYGTGPAQVSFTPSASGTYRVYYWNTSGPYSPHTKSFTVTVQPKVSLTAVSSVKRGATVTFTVKHPLASAGTGKLQYLSGGTWKTARTFALSSTKTTKVAYKVTSSHTWRAVVGSNVSASRTVTAK